MAGQEQLQRLDAAGEHVPTYTFPEKRRGHWAKSPLRRVARAKPPPLLWSFDDIHVDEARAICTALDARGEGG